MAIQAAKPQMGLNWNLAGWKKVIMAQQPSGILRHMKNFVEIARLQAFASINTV